MPVPINSTVPGGVGAAPTTRRADRHVRVQLGHVVVTRAVAQALMAQEGGRAFVISCLYRHARGDWGDLSAHDSEANDLALTSGARILSSFVILDEIRRSAADGVLGAPTPSGNGSDPRTAIAEERLWIITEAEDQHGFRPQTTVLFPSDY